MSDMLTIRQAVDRARQEGIPVSEYALRRWVKSGAVPVRVAGSKQLLYYPNLVRYLQCVDGCDNQPPQVADKQ